MKMWVCTIPHLNRNLHFVSEWLEVALDLLLSIPNCGYIHHHRSVVHPHIWLWLYKLEHIMVYTPGENRVSTMMDRYIGHSPLPCLPLYDIISFISLFTSSTHTGIDHANNGNGHGIKIKILFWCSAWLKVYKAKCCLNTKLKYLEIAQKFYSKYMPNKCLFTVQNI